MTNAIDTDINQPGIFGTNTRSIWVVLDQKPGHTVAFVIGSDNQYHYYRNDSDRGAGKLSVGKLHKAMLASYNGYKTLPEAKQRDLCRMVTLFFKPATIEFITDSEEIVNVYLNGPGSSCMTKPIDYFETDGIHPVSVYGGSPNLALAVARKRNGITSRCIVNIETKKYNSIYGCATTLKPLLENEGYSHGSLDGGLLQAIEVGYDVYVSPYVDGSAYRGEVITWKGKGKEYIQIGFDGELILGKRGESHQTGTTGNSEDYTYHCEDCGTGISEINMDYGEYGATENGVVCESCAENYIYIEGMDYIIPKEDCVLDINSEYILSYDKAEVYQGSEYEGEEHYINENEPEKYDDITWSEHENAFIYYDQSIEINDGDDYAHESSIKYMMITKAQYSEYDYCLSDNEGVALLDFVNGKTDHSVLNQLDPNIFEMVVAYIKEERTKRQAQALTIYNEVSAYRSIIGFRQFAAIERQTTGMFSPYGIKAGIVSTSDMILSELPRTTTDHARMRA